MARTSEFYIRFIESCFAGAATSTLPLSKIKREARLVFSSAEIEQDLMAALQKMADLKQIEIRGPNDSVCLLQHRPVNIKC